MCTRPNYLSHPRRPTHLAGANPKKSVSPTKSKCYHLRNHDKLAATKVRRYLGTFEGTKVLEGTKVPSYLVIRKFRR